MLFPFLPAAILACSAVAELLSYIQMVEGSIPSLPILQRSGAVWQLARVMILRPQVQILSPQLGKLGLHRKVDHLFHLLADRDKRCTITRRYDMNKEYIKTILAPYEANNDFLIKDGETIDDDVLK